MHPQGVFAWREFGKQLPCRSCEKRLSFAIPAVRACLFDVATVSSNEMCWQCPWPDGDCPSSETASQPTFRLTRERWVVTIDPHGRVLVEADELAGIALLVCATPVVAS
jgi:hypothetical protein